MASRRYLHASFWESPAALSISPAPRLLLVGCWTLADDEGLLLWNSATLKELLYSSDAEVTAEHVEMWMTDLRHHALVLRYRGSDGLIYGYILGFEQAQPVKRAKKSALPPPDLALNSTYKAYAWRDKHACCVCEDPIHAATGGPLDLERASQGLDGVVHTVKQVGRTGRPYPSQVGVAHRRCVDSVPAPTAIEPDTAPAAAPATVTDLSVPDAVLKASTPDATTTGAEPVDESAQDSLFVVPDEMVKDPEPGKKKKRADPASWTPDRKQQAHDILKPWWSNYGNGWPQSYGVVLGVIISVLANKVTAEDITTAMGVLGPERKPISGGTIGFALSKPSKQVQDEKTYEASAASRTTDKYAQRTL